MRRVALSALLLLFGVAIVRAEAPRRVVSFNLCADQLVLALADPQQIAGLSPYAADPNVSVMAAQARAHPRLDWQAESAVALKPDLVLTGSWDRAITRRMLSQLGFRVERIEIVADIAAAERQIREVAALLGRAERGEALVTRIAAARARLQRVRVPGLATALVIERGGFAAGPDSLAATLMTEAGLRPPAGAPGGIGGFVSLERLLMLKPDVLFLKDPPSEPGDQGALMFSHPALRNAWPPERRIAFPTRYTLCGGPALAEAMERLAEILERLR
jgi:iron complex transport system substrate-binding protein